MLNKKEPYLKITVLKVIVNLSKISINDFIMLSEFDSHI